MASNTLIGQWANGVWQDLGTPDCLNLLTISGYALQVDTLGRLNARLGTCYVPTGATGDGSLDYDIAPDVTSRELAIIGAMYENTYYRHLSMAMMGTSAGTLPVVNVREGDSSVSLANPVSIGKEYKDMAKDANERLNYLVNAYIGNSSDSPKSVDYLNPPVRKV